MPSLHSAQPHPRVPLLLFVGCLLLADWLPRWHKAWFVAESGHYGSNGALLLPLLLVAGLIRGWRPAWPLLRLLLLVQLIFIGVILALNLANGGPVLGFVLDGALRLLALGILTYAPALRPPVARS